MLTLIHTQKKEIHINIDITSQLLRFSWNMQKGFWYYWKTFPHFTEIHNSIWTVKWTTPKKNYRCICLIADFVSFLWQSIIKIEDLCLKAGKIPNSFHSNTDQQYWNNKIYFDDGWLLLRRKKRFTFICVWGFK